MEPLLVTIEECNRFFIVDQRWYKETPGGYLVTPNTEGGVDGEFAYICNAMMGPYARVYREYCSRESRWSRRGTFGFIVEARTKRQVMEWLTSHCYVTDFNSKLMFPTQQEGYTMRNLTARERKLAQAERTIERAQAQIDRLASLPDEPTTDDPDGALVIWFRHQFNDRSTAYVYAAVKASDGLWYTTGPASPKGYTWDELIDWHHSEVNEDTTVWVATEYEPI